MPIISTQINLEGAPLTAATPTNLFNYQQKAVNCALKGYEIRIGAPRSVASVFALYVNGVTSAANDLTVPANTLSASVTFDLAVAVNDVLGIRLKTLNGGEVAFPINVFLNIDDPASGGGGGGGTASFATITGLPSDNTALNTALNLLADEIDTKASTTALTNGLAGKENILTGGAAGSFTNANITVNSKGQVTAATNGTPGSGGATTWGAITGTLANQTDLNSALAQKADLVSGKIPAVQLPSYVDDVLEFPNFAAFPATGEVGKIYVALDSNLQYRWSGSVYIAFNGGSFIVATQAEAEAGTDNTKGMTPLRTKQAIAALGGSSPGAAIKKGTVTTDVSALATGGSGTYAAPYTGWITQIEAILAATGGNQTFVFPSGVYGYSASINWGKYPNVHYRGEGGTILKYTGTGQAIRFISEMPQIQPDGLTQFGITFENFIIDGSGTATDGIYCQSIHHSLFSNIFVRNVTQKRFHVNFGVCNLYQHLHLTGRTGDIDGLGEETTKAVNGFVASNTAGDAVMQACVFSNIIVETNTGDGMVLNQTRQCVFLGSTSEANGGKGIVIDANSYGNTFIGIDLEVNTNGIGLEVFGHRNNFQNITNIDLTKIMAGAKDNVFDGGTFRGFEITSGAEHTIIKHLSYALNYGTGPITFVNNSASTEFFGKLRNLTTGALEDYSNSVTVAFEYGAAVSDEITGLTAGNNKLTFRFPRAVNLTAIKASLTAASTSGAVTVDIKTEGNSVFGSSKLSIDATEKTSLTAVLPASFIAQNIADDAEITVDIIAAGAGAKGLKIVFLGTRL